jgi:hypothetical protein
MKRHPRAATVARACANLNDFVWKWMESYDLTYAEAISVITAQLGELSRFALQVERHPNDPERPADQAAES